MNDESKTALVEGLVELIKVIRDKKCSTVINQHKQQLIKVIEDMS